MTALTEKTEALVVSATALTESQLATLQDLLHKKLGKPVEISPRIDPALIGGLLIQVDGRVIDRSVKQQLSDLKNSIKKGVAG